MEYINVVFASYLMGSIPFGLILTKIFLKKDIREIGSGNIGATNALRTGNKFIGYSTLILDIAKAIIPVIYVKINFPELIYIASLCAFLGHVFPILFFVIICVRQKDNLKRLLRSDEPNVFGK
mgnify:CR=1 FL=1